MRRLFSLLAFLLIACSASAAKAGQDTFFPPENISQCRQGSVLDWDGPGHNTRCIEREVPAGAVMAFDLAECPAGWEPLAGAVGRTIVGAGGPGPDEALDMIGGNNFLTLTLEQMPRHSHNIRLTGNADDYTFQSLWTFDIHHTGYAEFDQTGAGAGEGGNAPLQNDKISGHTLIAANGDGLGPFLSNSLTGGRAGAAIGDAKEFDNRQAYIALLYCKKSADEVKTPCPVWDPPVCPQGEHVISGPIDTNGCAGQPKCIGRDAVGR